MHNSITIVKRCLDWALQRVSDSSEVKVIGTSFAEQASNNDSLLMVTYSQVASFIMQCEKLNRVSKKMLSIFNGSERRINYEGRNGFDVHTIKLPLGLLKLMPCKFYGFFWALGEGSS